MSLNGLDDAKLKEAHEAAVAEPGGWFLLKYASRDEVELLGQGNGGIVEVRNNISQYEETSPLYGFLRYRRRNVIIKYVPEGCSRLIQARVAVHFLAVCEHFAPSDTTFEITEAKELKDTKLSAACSLHTASESTSSSTSSLRRRRLMEIAEEDDEEEQRAAKRQSTVKEEATEAPPRLSISTEPLVTLNSDLATSPEAAQFSGSTDPPSFVGVPRPSSPTKSLNTEPLPRSSSQSVRNEYDYLYAYDKPRVKLGPRPSVDTVRSLTGNTSRPVASMPANLKLSSKGSKKGARKQDDSQSLINEEPAVSPIPEHISHLQPPRPHTSGGRPSSSSGVSIKSLASSVAPPSKHNTITPEKLRLMKAMQLREKKKRASAAPPPMPTLEVPAIPVLSAESEEVEAASEQTEAQDTTEFPMENQAELHADQQSFTKVESDSAIDIGSSIHHDQTSIDTRTDSRPASPIGASSEVGDSTKASSFSESTDETLHVQEKFQHQESDDVAEAQTEVASAPGEDLPAEPSPVKAEQDPATESEHKEGTLQGPITQIEESEQNVEAERDTAEILEDLSTEPSPVTATPEAGQAVVEPDSNPQNAELGPSKVDGVEIAPVETAERTEDGSAASPPKWKLPISKYSTQESKSPASATIPFIVPPSGNNLNGGEESITPTMKMDEEPSSQECQPSKRPEPIQTDLQMPDKNINLDDESHAEGAQTATIREAKPMILSKSPISASPPQLASRPTTPLVSRTASNPVRGPLQGSGDAPPNSGRAVSSGSAFLHKVTQQSAAHLAPKQPGKIGSSISQRIKALEQLAASAPAATLTVAASKERPQSAFFSVRKSSVVGEPRSPSVLGRSSSALGHRRSPSVLGRTDSLTQATPPRSDLEASPETVEGVGRGRSGSVASRLSVFEGANTPRGRPETIQVTARIVRDPRETYSRTGHGRTDSADYPILELKQSPLIIDHQKASPCGDVAPAPEATNGAPSLEPPAVVVPQEQRKSIQERRLSKVQQEGGDAEGPDGNRASRRTSLSIVKGFIKDRRSSVIAGGDDSPARPPSAQLNTSLTGRLSVSSRRSSDVIDNPISPSKPMSPTSAGDLSGSGDEKKNGNSSSLKDGKSRATRFMRRLSSSLSSTGGRNKTHPSISPTVTEENFAEMEAALAIPPPSREFATPAKATIIAHMGDVNVQFPDNLLWKRRTMALDSNGFLMLSASATSSIRDKQTRRYHLSDFRVPYTPEMEVEELPYSVCLDFVDGSGLQIACTNRGGQREVLQILQDTHSSHTSFGQ